VSVADGMREQLRRRRETLDGGAEHVGWKIGLNIPEVQRQLGIDEPVLGHLTSATVIEAGGEYDASGGRQLMAEPEVAVELGSNLDPGVDADGARQAIAGLAPAIELVDTGRPPRGEGIEAIVADNIFHSAVVLGPSRPPMQAEGVRATVSVNGEERASADSTDDLAEVVMVAARRLAEAGEQLRRGDRIIAGSITPQVGPLAPGDRVDVELTGLGGLRVAIAA
jgi:2-oxo-3-hexenedioate decarboxylase